MFKTSRLMLEGSLEGMTIDTTDSVEFEPGRTYGGGGTGSRFKVTAVEEVQHPSTVALCEDCARSMPWRQPIDVYSVDGCDLCPDTAAGAQLFEASDLHDSRPHRLVRGLEVGHAVLFHTDDPMDPAGWDGVLTVERIESTPRQSFSSVVQYDRTAHLSDGRTLNARGWFKVRP